MEDNSLKILELLEKVESGNATDAELREFLKLFKVYAKDMNDSIDEDVTRAKLLELYK